jgi:hypothetical protein
VVQILVEAGNFSPHCVQTGSRVHPASYPLGTRGPSLGVQWPGHEADHSHLMLKSRRHGAVHLLPQYTFMAWYSVKKEVQGQLYRLHQMVPLFMHPEVCVTV